MPAALHSADGNRICDQPRLGAGLDDEQAADFPQHLFHPQRLSRERASGGLEPFPRERKW
jgi:hypothetical protein